MPGAASARPTHGAFLATLIEHQLLVPSGLAGVYGRGPVFEGVRIAVDGWITRRTINERPRRMAFAPFLPREQLERIGYLSNFPHLAGTIFSFDGDEAAAVEQARRAEVGEDWSEFQRQTDLVLVPAACYPVYPAVAQGGPVPVGGTTIDLGGSYVFRHEPSDDPARWQMFHQREMVRIGEPSEVLEWRNAWSVHAVDVLRDLGLDAEAEIASDPFFGRAGRMLARSQREQALKLEVVVPISGDQPTAVASFNYHGEHFASVFDLMSHAGEQAHTACVGFGLERVTLALVSAHGVDVERWPTDVLGRLWPDGSVPW